MSIARTLFGEEHLLFRDALDRFIKLEAVPNYQRYEEQGYVDRDLWLKAGAAGFICSLRPEEEYGGAGADKVYSVVLFEQAARHAVQNLLGWALHSEIVAPYLLALRQRLSAGALPAADGDRRSDWRHRHDRANGRF